jgi:hypothetical protein
MDRRQLLSYHGFIWMTCLLVILAVLMLSGCAKSTEEIQRAQKSSPPMLMAEQDGVRLYKVRDVETGSPVYFTTKGDAAWTKPGDEDTPAKHFQVQGAK